MKYIILICQNFKTKLKMKNKNIVSIVVGTICLIVCLGIISDWNDIKDGLQLIRVTWLKLLITVCLSAPFMGLISCIYLIVKGGKGE